MQAQSLQISLYANGEIINTMDTLFSCPGDLLTLSDSTSHNSDLTGYWLFTPTDSLQQDSTKEIKISFKWPGTESLTLKLYDSVGTASQNLVAAITIYLTTSDSLSPPVLNTPTSFICPAQIPENLFISQAAQGAFNDFIYQWQDSVTNQNWQDIGSSHNTPSPYIFTDGLVAGLVKYYRLKATSNLCGSELFSKPVVLHAYDSLTSGSLTDTNGLSINDTLSLCFGSSLPPLRINASGGDSNYHYQWQYSTNGSLYADINGCADSLILSSGLDNLKNPQNFFRVIASDGCGQTFTSAPLTVLVYDSLEAGTIKVQNTTSRKDTNICIGESIALVPQVSAPGGYGGDSPSRNYKFQWLRKTISGNYSPVQGLQANSDSLQIINDSSLSAGTYYYRLEVQDSCGIALTDSVKVMAYDTLRRPSINLTDTIFCPGNFPTASITISQLPSGGSGQFVYQWEKSPDLINWIAAGNTSTNPDTFSFNSSNSSISEFSPDTTLHYRLKVYCPRCKDSVLSDPVTLYTFPQIQLGSVTGVKSQPFQDSLIICYGQSLDSLTVLASEGDGNFHYNWQYSSDGLSFNTIHGALDSSVLLAGLSNLKDPENYYRVVVTDDCSQSAISDTFLAIVYDSLQGGTLQVYGSTSAKDTALCTGESLSLTFDQLPAGGKSGYDFTAYQYQWLRRTATGSFQPLTGTGAHNASLFIDHNGVLQPGTYYYKLQVIDDCAVVETDSIKLTLYPPVNRAEIDTASRLICSNSLPQTIPITTIASGGNGQFNYTWQRKFAGTNTWMDLSSGTAPQAYVFNTNLLPDTAIYYRLRSNSLRCGTALYSDSLKIETYSLPTIYNSGISGINGKRSDSICHNTNFDKLWIEAAGGNFDNDYRVAWFYSADSSFSTIKDSVLFNSSGSTNILPGSSIGKLLGGSTYYFQAVLEDKCGNKDSSGIFNIYVYDELSPGSVKARRSSPNSDSIAICYGQGLVLETDTLPAGGYPEAHQNLDYQRFWQVDSTSLPSGFITIPSSDSLTLNIPANQKPGNNYYRLGVVDSLCGDTVLTKRIAVTVLPAPYQDETVELQVTDPNLYQAGSTVKLCRNQRNVIFKLNKTDKESYSYVWYWETASPLSGITIKPLGDSTFAFIPKASQTGTGNLVLRITDNTHAEQCNIDVSREVTVINTIAPDTTEIRKKGTSILLCDIDRTAGITNKTVYYRWGRLDRWYGNLENVSLWDTIRYHFYPTIDTSRYVYYVIKATDTTECYTFSFWPSLPQRLINTRELPPAPETPLYEVYPNPGTDVFNLKGDMDAISAIRLFNSIGITIPITFDKNEQKIHLQQAIPGYYLLMIKAKGHYHTQKIIIE
ncbi:MAG: hypothetical protein CMI35_00685 [Owenweeksia sp.]|nr:hypothetical protein [Owenweeksia sp.]